MGSGSRLPAVTTRPAKDGCEARRRASSELRILSGITGSPLLAIRYSSFAAGLFSSHRREARMGIGNESDQADRAISTGKLRALLPYTPGLSTWWSSTALIGSSRFEVGFPLRCLQRLSRPHIATLHCGWRHNSSTRGASIPVLSY